MIDATDSQCHRSRMEVRRMGRSIDGNYLFFDKNLQQSIFQVRDGYISKNYQKKIQVNKLFDKLELESFVKYIKYLSPSNSLIKSITINYLFFIRFSKFSYKVITTNLLSVWCQSARSFE